jgi:hypothetical protein
MMLENVLPGIILTTLNPPQFCARPMSGPGFPSHMICCGLFLCSMI